MSRLQLMAVQHVAYVRGMAEGACVTRHLLLASFRKPALRPPLLGLDAGLEVYGAEDKAEVRPCHHTFCSSCILQWLELQRRCPLCNQTITKGAPGGSASPTHAGVPETGKIFPHTLNLVPSLKCPIFAPRCSRFQVRGFQATDTLSAGATPQRGAERARTPCCAGR